MNTSLIFSFFNKFSLCSMFNRSIYTMCSFKFIIYS